MEGNSGYPADITRPVGRPPFPPHKRRDRRVVIYLTQAERSMLLKAARGEKKSAMRFVRDVVFGFLGKGN